MSYLNIKAGELILSPVVTAAQVLHVAFKELGYEINAQTCEKLSRFVTLTMSTRTRAFHDSYHALTVADVKSSIGKIAGLFHDVVYIQVDRSRLPELRQNFGVFDPGDQLTLRIPQPEILDRELWRKTIVNIFGFTSGQEIGPLSGINEFLSAWVTICTLKEIVSKWDLIQIISCIEATIPFRGTDKEGKTCTEALRFRLSEISNHQALHLSDEDLDKAVFNALEVANQDVDGFRSPDPGEFIDNSWALLYESNPSLQASYFSISQYRTAMQKMEGFYSFLGPEKVFRNYNNSPSQKELKKYTDTATKNLSIGREYIQAKLIDTCILEAFALLSGGDAPLEMFIGTKSKSRELKTAKIDDFLNQEIPKSPTGEYNSEVLALLQNGRTFRSRFDTKDSPLAAFIYQRLSRKEFIELFKCTQEYMKGQLKSWDYLTCVNKDLLQTIGESISKMVWTRRDEIVSLLQKLEEKKAA